MMTKRIFSALLAAALSLSLLAGCGSTSGSTASSAADGQQRYSTVTGAMPALSLMVLMLVTPS